MGGDVFYLKLMDSGRFQKMDFIRKAGRQENFGVRIGRDVFVYLKHMDSGKFQGVGLIRKAMKGRGAFRFSKRLRSQFRDPRGRAIRRRG